MLEFNLWRRQVSNHVTPEIRSDHTVLRNANDGFLIVHRRIQGLLYI